MSGGREKAMPQTFELDPKKSIEENANFYYEKAKKLKKKIPGTEKAIEKTKEKLIQVREKDYSEKNFIQLIKMIKTY